MCFRDGLLDFLQLAAFGETERKATSKNISSELIAFRGHGTMPGFLRFLSDKPAIFQETFYLIFARDWHAGDPVRLERMNLQELNFYFERNSSWYAWVYNYSARRYFPKLGLPLVVEISVSNL